MERKPFRFVDRNGEEATFKTLREALGHLYLNVTVPDIEGGTLLYDSQVLAEGPELNSIFSMVVFDGVEFV